MSPPQPALSEPVKVLVVLFGLFFCGFYVIYLIPEKLDEAGWWTHSLTTEVTFPKAPWLTSEFRKCMTLDTNPSTMHCFDPMDPGTAHNVPVLFHGRVDRKDGRIHSWRCQRNDVGFWQSNAITCWAVN